MLIGRNAICCKIILILLTTIDGIFITAELPMNSQAQMDVCSSSSRVMSNVVTMLQSGVNSTKTRIYILTYFEYNKLKVLAIIM